MYNITVDSENRARGCANLDIPLEELLAKPMTEQVLHDDNDGDDDDNEDDDKGLFTYYVSQKQGFLHPSSPLRQQWSAFG